MDHFRQFLILLPLLALCTIVFTQETGGDDLYQLLGLSKDATTKEIRKAFKNMAVKLHPDKNKDDENATTKFAQLTKAYEVLKDPDARKQYDLFGDIDERKNKKEFHTYTYYTDHLGIYDDDALIMTLTRTDFELYVIDSKQIWFVNFYSGQCHHCHELAPTWRKLSTEVEGVIQMGAVNCMEDWILCNRLGIQSYPTLLYFDGKSDVYGGIKYYGDRTLGALNNFIMSQVEVNIQQINKEVDLLEQNWLLILCPEQSRSCPEEDMQKKMAAILGTAIPVALVTNSELCGKIYKDHKTNPIVFYEINKDGTVVVHNIVGSDAKEIVDQITSLLPDPKQVNEEDFNEIQEQLKTQPNSKSLLICFYMGSAIEIKLQIKRLPKLLNLSGEKIDFGVVNCASNANLCSKLYISRYPIWGVLKQGSAAFELHTGRDTLHEISSFALESVQHPNVYTLTPEEFGRIKSSGEAWFIDWYAPWCPPCRQLIPEFRRASVNSVSENVSFGTIDCTVHSSLCRNEGIRAYPTTVLYTGDGKTHNFHGVPNENGMSEFISSVLNPMVIHLDEKEFLHIKEKTEFQLWVVSFYAPWCGPCNRLKPHLHRVVSELKHLNYVNIGQVDCEENANLCSRQKITHYPTIRMYPLDAKGMNTVIMYNSHYNKESLLEWLQPFLLKPYGYLSDVTFKTQVLKPQKPYVPWFVVFYKNSIPSSMEFLSTFENISGRLKEISSGLIDCENSDELCNEIGISQVPHVRLYTSPTKWHEINLEENNCYVIINKVRVIVKNHSVRDEL